MTDRYYPGQRKGLENKHLGRDEKKKLDRFRNLQARWHEAFGSNDRSFLHYKPFVKQMRNFFDLPAMFYLYYQRKEHDELEQKYANTFEGQLELAHKEANFFLDALELRAARAEEAYKKKDISPEGAAEYETALKDLEMLKEELRSTDLSQYREAIDWKMDLLYALGSPGNPDMRPSAERRK